jgi:hypothetical protein
MGEAAPQAAFWCKTCKKPVSFAGAADMPPGRLGNGRVVQVLDAAGGRVPACHVMSPDDRGRAAQVVIDALPHGVSHLVPGQVSRGNPADLTGLAAGRGLAADRPGADHDAELTAHLIIRRELTSSRARRQGIPTTP